MTSCSATNNLFSLLEIKRNNKRNPKIRNNLDCFFLLGFFILTKDPCVGISIYLARKGFSKAAAANLHTRMLSAWWCPPNGGWTQQWISYHRRLIQTLYTSKNKGIPEDSLSLSPHNDDVSIHCGAAWCANVRYVVISWLYSLRRESVGRKWQEVWRWARPSQSRTDLMRA